MERRTSGSATHRQAFTLRSHPIHGGHTEFPPPVAYAINSLLVNSGRRDRWKKVDREYTLLFPDILLHRDMEGVLVLDNQGNVLSANLAAESLLE